MEDPDADVVEESIALVRSAAQHGVANLWDYATEDPHRDARGFRVQRFETAFLRARPQRRPRARRPGDAFEVLRAEIGKLEKVAHQFSRALADDDATGRGYPLESGGQVRRVADDAALLRLSRTQQIAYDHDPSGDADSHAQRRDR